MFILLQAKMYNKHKGEELYWVVWGNAPRINDIWIAYRLHQVFQQASPTI